MSISKKVLILTVTLFTTASLVLYAGMDKSVTHFINLSSQSRSSTLHLSKTFKDLSADFETDTSYDESDPFSVLSALKRDGYEPVAVSDVEIYSSPPIPAIPCSDALQPLTQVTSVKQVNSVPLNQSEVVSNRTLQNGSTIGRCHPTDEGQLTSPMTIRVPNVVHYVFLGSDLTFTFANYLSYRSVDRFIRPNQIFVHGDHIPSGKWWNRTIDEVKNIYHVKRTYTNKAPNGQPYKYPAHISDYMRTETLLSYGGIYMDADVLVVKSFTPLRQFPFVIGREDSGGLCNGIMVAERGAPFLRLLLEQYRSYLGSNEGWAEKSVLNADKLARLYPHLVHVEETSLDRPNWKEKDQIYDGRYDWTKNYAVHLWIRLWPKEKRPNGLEDVLTRNTTLGELARLSMFGSPKIINNSTNSSYF